MAAGLDLRIDRGVDVPLGAQLAGRIRAAVESRQLGPGDRLPSVRELADAAGVNVNTARAVYARLESEGVVRSEHGRGTFVATKRPAGEAAVRRDLRRQIAQLEAELVRLPPPPEPAQPARPARAALLSTEDLEAVRDRLLERLDQLDVQRAAVMHRLAELAGEPPARCHGAPRRAWPALGFAGSARSGADPGPRLVPRERIRRAQLGEVPDRVGLAGHATDHKHAHARVAGVKLALRAGRDPHHRLRVDRDPLALNFDLAVPPHHDVDLLLAVLRVVVLRIAVDIRREVDHLDAERRDAELR